MAQRITRLTTDQKIPGSNPGKLETFFFSQMQIVIFLGTVLISMLRMIMLPYRSQNTHIDLKNVSYIAVILV